MKDRLESLDILRGFDMFFIFLPDPVPCIVLTFCAMMGWGSSAFARQFDHCAWAGLHFYDCIFPLFVFISGVTFPFSYARQVERGMTRAQTVRKIAWRALLLFALGAMLWTTIDGVVEKNVLSFEWETFRVWSVIGRIGLAWGSAALAYVFFGRRTRIALVAAVLAGMWAFLRFGVAPGAPDGVDPLVDRQWMLARWIDVNYLTTAHRGEGGAASVTMFASAMFGVFAGEILRAADATRSRKALRLLCYALGLTALGLLVAFAFGPYSLPIIKPVWTSSFALVTGGISAGLLALFYWIVDVKGWRRWGFFFKVIGMNAITLYLLVRTVFNWGFESEYFFGGIVRALPPDVGAFVSQAGMIALVWLFLLWLYRKGIFLRI